MSSSSATNVSKLRMKSVKNLSCSSLLGCLICNSSKIFGVYHQTYDLSYPALALQEDEVFGYSGCFNLLQEFFTSPKYAKGANSSYSSTPSPKKRKIIPDNAEVFDLTK